MDKKWCQVKNHPDAKKYTKGDVSRLICMITSKGHIYSGNYVFKDYLDTHDVDFHKQILKHRHDYFIHGKKIDLNRLNTIRSCVQVINGFQLTDDQYSSIMECNRGNIQAIIELCPEFLPMYKWNNFYCSGYQMVLYEGEWTYFCELPGAEYVGYTKEHAYHFITISGHINLPFQDSTGKYIITWDFSELSHHQDYDEYVDMVLRCENEKL